MKTIHTSKAPKAIGPYSQAVRSGNLLFCSGQIALDPITMKLSGETAREETFRIIENISEVLKEADLKVENVIKTTIFLKSMDDFSTVNDIYGEYFSHKPARSTIEVTQLPLGAKVEIEVIAEYK